MVQHFISPEFVVLMRPRARVTLGLLEMDHIQAVAHDLADAMDEHGLSPAQWQAEHRQGKRCLGFSRPQLRAELEHHIAYCMRHGATDRSDLSADTRDRQRMCEPDFRHPRQQDWPLPRHTPDGLPHWNFLRPRTAETAEHSGNPRVFHSIMDGLWHEVEDFEPIPVTDLAQAIIGPGGYTELGARLDALLARERAEREDFLDVFTGALMCAVMGTTPDRPDWSPG